MFVKVGEALLWPRNVDPELQSQQGNGREKQLEVQVTHRLGRWGDPRGGWCGGGARIEASISARWDVWGRYGKQTPGDGVRETEKEGREGGRKILRGQGRETDRKGGGKPPDSVYGRKSSLLRSGSSSCWDQSRAQPCDHRLVP